MNSPICPRRVAAVLLAASTAAFGQSSASAKATSAAPKAMADYGKLPLSFEANRGQADARVKFVSRGDGYSLFLTDKAAVLALRKPGSATQLGGDSKKEPSPQRHRGHGGENQAKTDILRMELAGAARDVRVEGAEKLRGRRTTSSAATRRSGTPACRLTRR